MYLYLYMTYAHTPIYIHILQILLHQVIARTGQRIYLLVQCGFRQVDGTGVHETNFICISIQTYEILHQVISKFLGFRLRYSIVCFLFKSGWLKGTSIREVNFYTYLSKQHVSTYVCVHVYAQDVERQSEVDICTHIYTQSIPIYLSTYMYYLFFYIRL